MTRAILVCQASLLLCSSALAQPAPPFFGGGTVAYDPEPGVVQSGVLLDAQAIVSHDRKYVTLNMRTTSSRLRELVRFPIVRPDAQGFVGGVNFDAGTGAVAGPAAATQPLLARWGMHLIARLE